MKREFYQASALLAATLLVSCAGPRASGVRYSPPSAAPVRTHITSAQDHTRSVKDDLRKLGILPDQSDKASRLSLLNDANKHVDALTLELTTAQTALNSLQKQTSDQTDELNRSNDEKNKALLSASEAAHRYHRLKFPVCLVGAAGALFLLMRFRLLAFLPPPYNFIGIAAVPMLVFGFLWLRL